MVDAQHVGARSVCRGVLARRADRGARAAAGDAAPRRLARLRGGPRPHRALGDGVSHVRGAASILLGVLALASPLAAQDTCPCPPVPAPGWDGSIGAGLAISSGNSDTRSVNVNGAAIYDPRTKHVFKASALY